MARVNSSLQCPGAITNLAILRLPLTVLCRKKGVLQRASFRGLRTQAFYGSHPYRARSVCAPVKLQTSWTEAENEQRAVSSEEEEPFPERWDVVGVGQAMVDFSGIVSNTFLENLGLEKGVRKIVNHEERGKVLQALDGCSFKASAGGSLSNTLVALARLGSAKSGSSAFRVAMTGSVGNDPLGGFYRAKLLKANVHFVSPPILHATTGTVVILTTPDAQRTMLSYQGMSAVVNFDSALVTAISAAQILIIEGYLWEIPKTVETIAKICETARENGALVALTASDVACVSRHWKQFWDIMASYADILFANSDEARAICGFGEDISPGLVACYLSEACSFVSVTDGAKGSYIGVGGEVVHISPSPCIPVDTCGAGDAYAAGILYGILTGVSDLKTMGSLAAEVAAVVVGQQGTRLKCRDALILTRSLSCEGIEERPNLCSVLDSD